MLGVGKLSRLERFTDKQSYPLCTCSVTITAEGFYAVQVDREECAGGDIAHPVMPIEILGESVRQILNRELGARMKSLEEIQQEVSDPRQFLDDLIFLSSVPPITSTDELAIDVLKEAKEELWRKPQSGLVWALIRALLFETSPEEVRKAVEDADG